VAVVRRIVLGSLVVIAAGLLAAGGGQAGKRANTTYGVASQEIRGVGTTDKLVAVKRPDRYVLGSRDAYFVIAKLRPFKGWGEAKTRAKARSLKLCDTRRGDNCSKTKRGRVAFRARRKATCEVRPGEMKTVWLYSRVDIRQPPHGGYPKGRNGGGSFGVPPCPKFF
jgi:hypothetical protein